VARTPSQLAIHRVGIGTDLHRLEAGRPLILGHVRIPFDKGPLGHSDGDVVLHALIDAIAGGAGMPDIGEMFPDTDPAYRDADSAGLLAGALRELGSRGYAVVNADVTIHAERPKLSPHKPAIRAEVARLLDLPLDAVSIKAKTNEGVDAVGRGEAIACTAVVGLHKLNEQHHP
jgi:2-C-methyl-D-erythritol 2,4-cyclodiphosphate synthase